MGDFYGYNPSDYRTNYVQMFGNIGAAIDKTASVMPELLELHKQIKQNKAHNNNMYEALKQGIGRLDDATATNLASSMGIEYDPNNPQDAKSKISSLIPDPATFGDKLTSEDYTKNISTGFIVKLINAAESPAGGGSISKSELLSKLVPAEGIEYFYGTNTGKSYLEDRQYQKSFDRRYGPSGEVVTEQNLRNENQLAMNQKEYDITQQRESNVMGQVDDILANVSKSEEVWSTPELDQYDPKAREKAYTILSNKEANELRIQLKDMDKQLRDIQSTKKPVSVDIYDDLLNSIDGMIIRKSAQIDAHLKNKQAKKNNPNLFAQQTEKMKRELEQLKIRQTKAFDARDEFLKNADFTIEGYNRASRQSDMNYDTKTKPEEEQQFIEQLNTVKGWFLGFGRDDEEKEIISNYRARFGVDPVRDPTTGKYLPQFKESSFGPTGGGIKLKLNSGNQQPVKQSDDDLINSILNK